MEYEPVIGLEVHVQLCTKTKLFCGCPATFGAPPNSQTCPVCLGLPGVLPVLNQRALEWGIRVALALDCRIARRMKFDRKQYFYPDLPKNFQISQYDQPLAQQGHLDIELAPSTRPPQRFASQSEAVGGLVLRQAQDSFRATQSGVEGLAQGSAPPREVGAGLHGRSKRIGIHRIHLEEDTGKLLHDAGQTESLVDFNRAGVPLLEIVSEPDLRSPAEAVAYLTRLKAVLQYLQVSTCNMEEGSLRCDTNVSLRRQGIETLGTKVEIKNLNSFRFVKLALEHEMARQAAALDRGDVLRQETRLWDAKALKTEPMRSKEEASDYRYFPEPDLVPFVIEEAWVTRLRAGLPELPAQRAGRFQQAYQLSAYDAAVLTGHWALAELFEGAVRAGAAPKPAANWIMGEWLASLNAHGLEPDERPLRPEWLAHLVQLIEDGTLSGKMAKEVFGRMVEQGVDPAQIVKEEGLRQVDDPAALERIAEAVVQANAGSVEAYLSGKVNALTFLMGQAMKQSGGKVHPRQMAEVLKRKLETLSRR